MRDYFKTLGAPIVATVTNALLAPFYSLVTGIDGDIVFNIVRVAIWIVAGWRLASLGGFGVWKSALSGAILLFIDHAIIKGGYFLIRHQFLAFDGVLISYCLLWFVPVGFAAIGAVVGKRQRVTESVASQPQYECPHGWLFLFCILQIVIIPFLMVYRLSSGWIDYVFRNQPIPGLTAFDVAGTIMDVGIVAFGFYTAQSLWQIKPRAVQLAKRFLLTALGCCVVGLVVPLGVGLPASWRHALFDEAVARLIFGFIWFALWYSYFVMSKRIRSVYGGPVYPA